MPASKVFTEFSVKGADRVKKALTDQRKTFTDETSKMSRALVGVGLVGAAAASVIAIGFQKVYSIIAQGTEEAEKFDRQMSLLRGTFEDLAEFSGFGDISFNEATESMEELFRRSFFAKSEIARVQAAIARTTKQTDVFRKAVESTFDIMAARPERTAEATAQWITVLIGDPSRAVEKLRREEIWISQAQQQYLRNLVAEGKIVQAQLAILDIIQARFGGAIEEAAGTTAGRIKKSEQLWNEFTRKAAQSYREALLPAAEAWIDSLEKNDEAVQTFFTTLANLTTVAAEGVAGLITQLNKLGQALDFGNEDVSGLQTIRDAAGFFGVGSEGYIGATRRHYESLLALGEGISDYGDRVNLLAQYSVRAYGAFWDSAEIDRLQQIYAKESARLKAEQQEYFDRAAAWALAPHEAAKGWGYSSPTAAFNLPMRPFQQAGFPGQEDPFADTKEAGRTMKKASEDFHDIIKGLKKGEESLKWEDLGRQIRETFPEGGPHTTSPVAEMLGMPHMPAFVDWTKQIEDAGKRAEKAQKRASPWVKGLFATGESFAKGMTQIAITESELALAAQRRQEAERNAAKLAKEVQRQKEETERARAARADQERLEEQKRQELLDVRIEAIKQYREKMEEIANSLGSRLGVLANSTETAGEKFERQMKMIEQYLTAASEAGLPGAQRRVFEMDRLRERLGQQRAEKVEEEFLAPWDAMASKYGQFDPIRNLREDLEEMQKMQVRAGGPEIEKALLALDGLRARAQDLLMEPPEPEKDQYQFVSTGIMGLYSTIQQAALTQNEAAQEVKKLAVQQDKEARTLIRELTEHRRLLEQVGRMKK